MRPSSHHFTSACNYQIQLLHPREFPSAEALQQRQQLSFAEFLVEEIDLLAIEGKEHATHSHTCHTGEYRIVVRVAGAAFKRLGAAAAAGGTKRAAVEEEEEEEEERKKKDV